MRICFFSPFAYPLFNPTAEVTHGGAELDVVLTARELSSLAGIEVTFVVGDFGQRERERYGDIDVLRSLSYRYTGPLKLAYGLLIGLPKLWRALWRANAEVYIQKGAGIETFAVAVFCRFFRRKFVYRLASSVDYDGTFRKQYRLVGLLHAWGMHWANAVLAQSKTQADEFLRLFGKPSTPIYNATTLTSRSAILERGRREYVLWVGRLVRIKHPEKFLALAASRPDETFVMLSPTSGQEDGLESEIRSQVVRLPNVRFVPGVAHAHVDPYYQRAKVLVNTSEYEGYPNTFIEAGKYGVPILSLMVDPDYMLTSNDIGACANGNEELLSPLLTSLLQPDQWQAKSRAIRQYVETNNHPAHNAQQYVHILHQMGAL